jgi:hypothetical protein
MVEVRFVSKLSASDLLLMSLPRKTSVLAWAVTQCGIKSASHATI